MIYPELLKKGDKVAVISPASPVKPEFIDSAAEFLRGRGLEPVVMPHAKGPAQGSYGASAQNRLDDFLAAWMDREVKAVLCSRGGYGAVHLLPHVPGDLLRDNPKWLIGFSDITALHALSLSQGVASLHAPMAKDLRNENPCALELMEILMTGRIQEIEYDRADTDTTMVPLNIPGHGEGILAGGNLAVLDGLAATPFDLAGRALVEDTVLFIEDIAEPIYKTERILWRLYMQGVLSRVKGLIVGRFTENAPDRNFLSTAAMISSFLHERGLSDFPVCFDFPTGHFAGNRPLVEGARVRLETTGTTAVLRSEIVGFD